MDWVEKLNATIDYIEANLAAEVDYAALAQIAGCSSYHYQRMFTYMAGFPLGEYIRRRKMTLAAEDLQKGNKVIDVAIKYGYSSPTAFTRAFQAVHDISPSDVKTKGGSVQAYCPLTFTISIKGVEPMEYRIEQHDPIRIVGVSSDLSANMEDNFQAVPGMWAQAGQDGTITKLVTLIENSPQGLLGVSVPDENDQWKYFIAVASSRQTDEFEEYVLPSSTWAIFPGAGSATSLQELEKRIVTDWLPTSGYEYGNAGDIEVYLNPDPHNATYEVWISVRKAA